MLLCGLATAGEVRRVEVSDDGREVAAVEPSATDGLVTVRSRAVLYGAAPDWQNSLRRQIGGLVVADMNDDGRQDLVVGCYNSQSFPPYDDWRNMIYFNSGTELAANPGWISTDQVSTTEVQVGDIDNDGFPDIFAANGGFSLSPSVVYWGTDGGPFQTPGWTSQTPIATWATSAALADIDHDDYLEVVTANQGTNPNFFRPIYQFGNTGGVLSTTPTWQSAEQSLQSWVAFGDYNNDGWDDLAVSKWNNGFFSGIHRNNSGTLSTVLNWTWPVSDTDKGVAWGDVDGNGWLDLALGHSPTQLFGNTNGSLALVWTSQATTAFSHQDLKFCDIDRDGDPDLAEVHFSNGITNIYLNDNGVLDSVPTWTYDAPVVGTALAFGDINGDQWPDLVIGYAGNPSIVVFYAQPPAGDDCNSNGIPDELENCADLNGDGIVDAVDYQLFRQTLGRAVGDPQFNECADYDGTGAVGLGDFQTWLGCYRDSVGDPLAPPPVDGDADPAFELVRPQPLGVSVETDIKPDKLAIPNP
jgi:hypothetical protein